MNNDPLVFFGVTSKEITNKIREYSDLEISENHQGVALSLMLQEEGVVLPNWCMFLLNRGLVSTRRELLHTYSPKQAEDAPTGQ